MDSCGGCGSGGEGELPPAASTLTHVPRDKDRTRKSTEKLLTAGDQWSQEENSEVGQRPSPNHHSLTNGVVNGLHQGGGGGGEQSLLNNNLVEEKCNLRCADDKSFCLYHKFPAKVNNNAYPERGNSAGDGMDEYFQSHHPAPGPGRQPLPPPQARRNELSPSRELRPSPDQLNLLNGEEEDEDDGCFYTYKGESLEANFSHLIDMCLSCGLPNTERGAVPGPRPRAPPEPPSHNNLFSPDMDFLEMDFDPGPSGDGEADSDCEDNCLHECDTRLGRGGSSAGPGADRKASNYCPEMLSLMCRRCESSLCGGGKIDNVALNLSVSHVPPSGPALNIGRGPSTGLDHRPDGVGGGAGLNLPRDGLNLPTDLNQLCVGQRGGRGTGPGEDEDYDAPDNDSVENNLVEADLLHDLLDDGLSDDADDEDDSNSEKYDPRGTDGVGDTHHHHHHQHHTSARDLLAGTHHKHTNNNNLGSVSAPEVSPAREYTPLEKFGRSLSFHNQLSSPKYENVCFTPRPRREEPQAHHLGERTTMGQTDAANLAACAGRLHRRENAVFNILAESFSQNGNCSSLGAAAATLGSRAEVAGPSPSPNTSSPSAASQPPSLRHNPPLAPLLKASPDPTTTTATTTTSTASTTTSSTFSTTTTTTATTTTTTSTLTSRPLKGGGGADPCPLPVKSLRPKNTDPCQDPNTASEGEGGGDESCPRVKKVMIWTELQASARQVTQIATSACGATAIINVLLALDYSYSVEEVKGSIQTRLRAETAPVVDYLLSRSVAGTTHHDLIQGVTQLSHGAIKAKFFHMFPKRVVQLSRWLAQWILRGGVPLATLNLQVGVAPGQTIPDAWHHQMIFGVGPQGVYLTNPLECVSDCMLGDQLCTDSVLLVRRADVVERWGNGDKLVRLTQHEDQRWRDMNVLGQVVGVLKEQVAPPVVQGRRHLTSHVAIPAAYKSGVTIFMRSDNPHLPTLMQAEELPLLE